MAAPTLMNLKVPAGNISFIVQIRSQLAERAAYWRQQWTIEKDSKKKVFNNRTKKWIAPQPKWGFMCFCFYFYDSYYILNVLYYIIFY